MSAERYAKEAYCGRTDSRLSFKDRMKPLCYAVALGLSHEGGRSFDPQEFESSWKSPDM